jgi:hypothetical protein
MPGAVRVVGLRQFGPKSNYKPVKYGIRRGYSGTTTWFHASTGSALSDTTFMITCFHGLY